MSALPCGICKVEHFSGEHAPRAPRVYKTFPLILEKYPTLSRVWEGKFGPCVAESKRTLCVFPGRRVSVVWRKTQKRRKRQCPLPELVTKWGKVLISLKLFCQRTRVGWVSARVRSAPALFCENPFPHACFLLRTLAIHAHANGEEASTRGCICASLLLYQPVSPRSAFCCVRVS